MFIFLQIPEVWLIVLGSLLHNDIKLSGPYVNELFWHIYILGINLMDIIRGFGNVMICIGSVDLVLNMLALVSDLIHHNKTRNKIVWTLILIFD